MFQIILNDVFFYQIDVGHQNLMEPYRIHQDHVKVTEVTSLEGEASASNRKGKLFFFYEWEIKADWEGRS